MGPRSRFTCRYVIVSVCLRAKSMEISRPISEHDFRDKCDICVTSYHETNCNFTCCRKPVDMLDNVCNIESHVILTIAIDSNPYG